MEIVDLLNEILESVIANKSSLMKLKLSNMNLRSELVISSIFKIIKANDNLIFLDLSWAKL